MIIWYTQYLCQVLLTYTLMFSPLSDPAADFFIIEFHIITCAYPTSRICKSEQFIIELFYLILKLSCFFLHLFNNNSITPWFLTLWKRKNTVRPGIMSFRANAIEKQKNVYYTCASNREKRLHETKGGHRNGKNQEPVLSVRNSFLRSAERSSFRLC